VDNARAGDKGDGSRNKKKRTNAWGETKAVVAIHTFLQLHDPTPPLRNRNRISNVREIAPPPSAHLRLFWRKKNSIFASFATNGNIARVKILP
jgi:hypothetical protein